MVAPVIAAAGISAVGSVLGGIGGGKGAKKAQQAALQGQRETIAAADRNRDYQYNLNAPTITGGNAAGDRIRALLGLSGDAGAANAAFHQFRDASGYQNIYDEGLRAVNTSRFAGGAGMSGATLRRLQETGAEIGNRSLNQYLAQLGGVEAQGANARGLVAGVGANTTNTIANAIQTGTQGQINGINAGTANFQNTIQNLANAGNYALAYGSSYKPAGLSGGVPPGFGSSAPYNSAGFDWSMRAY